MAGGSLSMRAVSRGAQRQSSWVPTSESLVPSADGITAGVIADFVTSCQFLPLLQFRLVKLSISISLLLQVLADVLSNWSQVIFVTVIKQVLHGHSVIGHSINIICRA